MNDSQSQQEILKQGQLSEFWQIIVQFIRESKEHLRQEQRSQDLKNLPAEQYKLENELILSKLEYLDKLTDYPNTIIGWLQNPDNEDRNYDPYQ